MTASAGHQADRSDGHKAIASCCVLAEYTTTTLTDASCTIHAYGPSLAALCSCCADWLPARLHMPGRSVGLPAKQDLLRQCAACAWCAVLWLPVMLRCCAAPLHAPASSGSSCFLAASAPPPAAVSTLSPSCFTDSNSSCRLLVSGNDRLKMSCTCTPAAHMHKPNRSASAFVPCLVLCISFYQGQIFSYTYA